MVSLVINLNGEDEREVLLSVSEVKKHDKRRLLFFWQVSNRS